jgi:hypothetical protein
MIQESEIFLLDDRLVVLYGGNQEMFIRWNEVYAIHLEKVNLINSISIALIFDYENGEYFEVGDVMQGWDSLINNLGKYIPLIDCNLIQLINLCNDEKILTIYKR